MSWGELSVRIVLLMALSGVIKTFIKYVYSNVRIKNKKMLKLNG